jgi:predicted nucleic acid-binding Zn ribbon protein
MTERQIADGFDAALRALGVRRQVREAQVATVFADVVGAQLAAICRATSLERGTLCIATAHSALAHQLQLEAPQLIAALNARMGTDAVRRLRFVPLSA